MKKTLLFAAGLLVAGMLQAQDLLTPTEVDGIYYLLDSQTKTATVSYALGETGGYGTDYYSGHLNIPETIWAGTDSDYAEYTVTAIGDNAFVWNTNLTQITIPATVKTVGVNLLQRSPNVTTLKIADGDEPIYFTYNQGDYGEEISFAELAYSCTYLYLGRNVEVNTSVEWFSPVFHTWTAIQDLVIGEKVTKIPDALCRYTRDIQSIQINTATPIAAGQGMLMFLEEDADANPKAITLYVPEGQQEAYAAMDVWKNLTITEMGIEKQYGIKYVDGQWDFHVGGLFYKKGAVSAEGMVGVSVVMPQVWYINPDGSYVSTWSSEFPYKQATIVIPAEISVKEYDETVVYPVVEIADYAFRGASNLQSITIPNTVTTIGGEAFEGTDKLKTIDIPESVTSVGWLAFARAGFEEVTIPASSSKWIDNNAAFQDNANLTKVTFAQGTTAIQDRIFFGCVALRTIIIPDEVIYIGPGAFAGCEALTEIHLPASLQVLNNRLFRGCPLRSLEIPAGVIEIEGSALLGTNIAKLTVNPANTVFDSRDNCNAIIRTADNTLVAATDGAFIPASVDSIAQEAFNELYGIRSLTLPANLKHIAPYGFMNLENLTLITSHIQKPAGALGQDAFENWYGNTYETATLYVPSGTLAAYRADEQWNRFQNIVEMTPETKPASVEDIAPIAESGTTSLAALATNADLTNAVVGNLYLTCDTTNGDHYDAAEQALVLNTVVDSVMMENVLANPDNMDVIRNNFSGMILTIPAGTGTLNLTIKTTGNREIAILVEGSEAETFAQAVKGQINIPYSVENKAYVFIYGIVPDEPETPASVPSKFRARAKRAHLDEDIAESENSVSIYDVQWVVTSSTTGIEDVHTDASSTPRKIMIDNIIYILRGGKIYTIQGLEVK